MPTDEEVRRAALLHDAAVDLDTLRAASLRKLKQVELRWDNPDDRMILNYRRVCRRMEQLKRAWAALTFLAMHGLLPKRQMHFSAKSRLARKTQ